MTKPSISYEHGYLTDCNSYYNGTSGTADSGDTTYTVDSERTEANDHWNDCFIKFTSGPNIGLERKITDFDAATDTITHDAFPNAVATGHIYLISSWAETEAGSVGSVQVLHDDLFDIYIDSASDGKVYYLSYPGESGSENLNLSSTTYKKAIFRYCANAGPKAKIVLVFNTWNYGQSEAQNIAAGNGQIILAETTTSMMTAGAADITAGKTIDHVRLYANGSTGVVYYDFLLLCKGIFTIPNTQFGKQFIPAPRNIALEIPSRITDINQNLGSKSAVWRASCNLDIGNWKRTGDIVNGQVFDEISHNSYKEPFQWFNTGMGRQFKVVCIEDTPQFREENKQHLLDLAFREYSRMSKSNDSPVERFGLNL